MKTTAHKKLALFSVLAFGLIAACSDDSASVQAPAEETQTSTGNICQAENFTGYYAADGVTIMCFDEAGNLVFWIGEDGSVGMPETESKPNTPEGETPTGATSNDTVPAGSSAADTGSTGTPAEPVSSSAVEQGGCDASGTTKLYSLAGVDYYRDANTAATFYFNDDCEKIFLTEIVASSSSETPVAESSSSSRNKPASSSSNVTDPTSSATFPASSAVASSSSIATPTSTTSNGNDPVITYAASGATVTNNNGCIEAKGGEVVITCAGDYDFSGSYTGNDAQIRVYSPKSDSGVYLNLRGLTLTNNADAVIYVQMASKAFVVAKSGTENTLSDASNRTKTYTYVNANNETKVDTTGACIYAKDDLTIKGEGTLTVKGNYNNGIHSSNDLRFRGETKVSVTAKNHGLKGKELVDVEQGNITIKTTSGDGIHGDLNVVLTGGNITINAGDDGIHADSALHLAGSTVNVEKAGEGMEAFYIFAEAGITATYGTDDGWNAAGGSADGSTSTGTSQGGWSMGGGMGGMGGGPQSSSKGYIVITGGYHYISASGNDIDVLDANGTAKQSGGVVITEIPTSGSGGMGGGMGGGRTPGGSSSGGCSTNNAGGLIDTDQGFTITGGVFLGFGNQTEEYPNCSATSYTAGTAYGSANAAFAPKGSGSMILYGGSVSSVGQVNTSGMSTVEFPNGLKYYYK